MKKITISDLDLMEMDRGVRTNFVFSEDLTKRELEVVFSEVAGEIMYDRDRNYEYEIEIVVHKRLKEGDE